MVAGDPAWLHRLESCPSTNDVVRARLGTCEPGDCVWTRRQTAGRGQHGRRWWSDEGVLTATFAIDGFRLRDDWKRRGDELRRHKVLSKLAATDFIQTVTLLAARQRRIDWVREKGTEDGAPGGEQIGRASCRERV